jgi:hypothetical protein
LIDACDEKVRQSDSDLRLEDKADSDKFRIVKWRGIELHIDLPTYVEVSRQCISPWSEGLNYSSKAALIITDAAYRFFLENRLQKTIASNICTGRQQDCEINTEYH